MATRPFRKAAVTPAGIAEYPWLLTPDTRFGDPTYKVNVRISGDEGQAFVDQVETMKAEALTHLKEDPKNNNLTDLITPIVAATADDGSVIPKTWIVKCKTRAFFKNKDGSLVENKLQIVDSKKAPMNGVNIWGGSTLKVAITIGAVATSIYKGLVFRIAGVQVLDLVSGGSQANSMFKDEDGFVADESMTKEILKPVITQAAADEVDF